MKKNKGIIFYLLIFSIFFTTCHNSIMETWWDDSGHNSFSSAYYEVIFQDEGGQPTPGIQHIAPDGRVMKVQPISRGGHAFAGWFTAQTGGKEWDFANDRVTSNLTLYARWEMIGLVINIYTVKFEHNGGNLGGREYLLDTQFIVEGSRVIEPPAMRKATSFADIWYGFGGWFTDPAFAAGSEWDFAANRVYENMTLYAKWEDPPFCFVTFDPNGGSPEPRSQDLLEGTKIVEPLAMNRTGYGFGGWFTDPDFAAGSEWNFNTPVNSGIITLYAKWVTNEYIITFNADGGNPAPGSQRAIHGTLLSAPSLMKKPGQAFLGWFTSDGKEWNFAEDKVTSNLNLYAKWGDAHYFVKFDLKLPDGVGGGSGGHGLPPPPDQELSLGRKISEPVPNDISGWSFYGWFYSNEDSFNPANQAHRDALIPWDFDWSLYLNVDGDLIISSNGETVLTKNESGDVIFTLYARWVPFIPDMVWVRKGSFTMGAAGAGTSPARTVKFETGFYMARNLVTQEGRGDSYKEIMEGLTNYNATPGSPGSSTPSQFKASQPTRPVDRVSWFDAVVYSNRRSLDEDLYPVYSLNGQSNPSSWGSIGWNANASIFPESWNNITADFSANGYRLPTEAEWEYAARGGNGSPGNFTYAGSNTIEDVAWFNTNSGSQTHPVGTKQPNALGIYDMSGNVMEWCWDWYDTRYYRDRYDSLNGSYDIDPKGPVASSVSPPERVRRGGSWNNAINNMRTIARASFVPNNNTWVMGIRVVRNVDPMEIY